MSKLRAYLWNQRTEPFEKYWINISRYSLESDDSPAYIEHYDLFDQSDIISGNDCLTLFNIHDASERLVSTSPNTLFTMKIDDILIYRNIPSKERVAELVYDVKSKTRFIGIEYRHPKMSGVIQIDLPIHTYYAGNEILSPTFILRYLKYQSNPFVFDEDYKITLIDSNVQFSEMKWTDYCVLLADGYEIARG